MKTNTPTTTELLIQVAENKKPTKNQIIEAIIDRAREKHDAEQKKIKEDADIVLKKIKVLAIKEANKTNLVFDSYFGEPEFKLKMKSPMLNTLKEKYHVILGTRSCFHCDFLRKKLIKKFAQKPIERSETMNIAIDQILSEL